MSEHYGKDVLKRQKREYLAALDADPEHRPRKAMLAAGIDAFRLGRLRKDRVFMANEVAIIEKSPFSAESSKDQVLEVQNRLFKEAYLTGLEENFGSEGKALANAGITAKKRDELLRDDEDFRAERESVYERLRERLTEEAMRVALGEEPKTKDSPHLRWMMGKLMPDKFGEKPKQVEHHYSGKMTVEHIDAELAMLLGDDDVEQLERP